MSFTRFLRLGIEDRVLAPSSVTNTRRQPRDMRISPPPLCERLMMRSAPTLRLQCRSIFFTQRQNAAHETDKESLIC
jgi:hypothetical protein